MFELFKHFCIFLTLDNHSYNNIKKKKDGKERKNRKKKQKERKKGKKEGTERD